MKITPRGWEKFQHYNKRNPPWIKLHKSLIDDLEFQCLHDASKALAMCIWLLASEHKDGIIDTTLKQLCFRLRMNEIKFVTSLKSLSDSGFMSVEWEDASTVLARCYNDATPETETETETETKEKAFSPLLPLTEIPPIAEVMPETATATKMMINDFRFIHNSSFGFQMPPGCNNMASEFCQHYTADQIRQGFEAVSAQNPDKHNMAYLKTVLANIGKPKLAVVKPAQEVEAYGYPTDPEYIAERKRLLAAKQAKMDAEDAEIAAELERERLNAQS